MSLISKIKDTDDNNVNDLSTEYEWVKFACESNNLVNLHKFGFITIEVNKRLTRTLGRARPKYRGGISGEYIVGGMIEISGPLWKIATEEQRRQNVIHETCHVIDYVLNQSSSHHGEPWKTYMRNCGLKPRRCHNVNAKQLRRNVKRHSFNCGCNDEERFCTTVVANRVNKGWKYTCNKCNQDISITGKWVMKYES